MCTKPEHPSGELGLREDESSELSSGIKREEPYVRCLRGVSLSETGCHMEDMVLLLCRQKAAIQELIIRPVRPERVACVPVAGGL